MKVKSVGTFGDEARIAMVVIHPVRDQDTRSEMAIIVIINELNIGAVTGPATRQVAQPLFLPGIDTQHQYAAGSSLEAQGSDQPEIVVIFG